jgi:hypothetical protein
MKILIFLIVVLIIFVSPLFLFLKLIKGKAAKQKKSSWKGKLVDKKQLEWEDEDDPYPKHLYTLYFETTEGEQIKINVAKKVFEDWHVNDKAEKTEGKLLPEKIV